MEIRLIPYLLLALLVSCSSDDSPVISNQAKQFLNEVLDIMEVHSINKDEIDWADFETKVFNSVGDAKTIQDTYPGIMEALVLLGDNHSFFVKPDGSSISASTVQCDFPNIVAPTLPENIGYVKISSNSIDSYSEAAIAYAEEIQNQIMDQDNFDIIGWIVDLRSNRGGSIYPMIAGIGPILGEGIAGYFVYPDGYTASWGFSDGSATYEEEIITKLSNSHELAVSNPKVAILLNNGVASAAEAVAISFIGKENTKSFGMPTCGVSSGNSAFFLSDDSILYLTTSFMADRNKNVYGASIDPDEIVPDENIIQRAIEWLENE